MKKIIIASHEKDQAAVLLHKKLTEKSHNSEIINLGDFSKNVFSSIIFDEKQTLKLNTKENLYSEETIKSIWWRRPKGPATVKSDDLLDDYINIEKSIAIDSFFKLTKGVKWVSDPEATRIGNLKPLQLALARQIGFKIPITCITNNKEDVVSFIERHIGMPLIMKAVGSAFVRLTNESEDEKGENKVIFTKIVKPETILENIDSVTVCPFILQEAIKKTTDIRVTVVGSDVFASEIKNTDQSNPNMLDWRYFSGERIYSYHRLPYDIENLCTKLVSEMNLKFGCIDLGFSEKDGYTFFEINPQGQWLPSELKVGHKISDALISLLAS